YGDTPDTVGRQLFLQLRGCVLQVAYDTTAEHQRAETRWLAAFLLGLGSWMRPLLHPRKFLPATPRDRAGSPSAHAPCQQRLRAILEDGPQQMLRRHPGEQ